MALMAAGFEPAGLPTAPVLHLLTALPGGRVDVIDDDYIRKR